MRESNLCDYAVQSGIRCSMVVSSREGLPVSCEAPELRAVLWENPMYGISGGAAGNIGSDRVPTAGT